MRFVLLVFLSLPLLAARQPAEVRSILQDRDKINAASFNDPTQLINDTLEILPSLDPKNESRVYIQALEFLATMTDLDKNPLIDSHSVQAEELAIKLGDFPSEATFRIRRARKSGSREALEKTYQDCLQIATSKGLKEDVVRLKVEYANRLSDWGQTVMALKEVQEAIELGKDPAVHDKIVVMSSKIQAMMLYEDLGMRDESIDMLKELIAACHERGFTYMEGALLHNLGHTLTSLPERREEAGKALQQALSIAEAFGGDSYLITNIKIKQAELLHQQKNDKTALAMAEKAAQSFASLDNPLREADAYKKAARYAWAMDQSAQALEYARKAAVFFNKDYPEDNEELQKLFYEIYLAEGKTAEALHSLQEWIKQREKTDKIKDDLDFKKLSVKFGLEGEREKTRRLSKDKETVQIMLVLAGGLLLLALAAFQQSRRVASGRRQYQQVMEATNEGILSFDASLRVQSGFSPVLNQHLHGVKRLAGHSFMQLLQEQTRLDAESLTMIQSALMASFGEEALAWELNEAHLPQEIVLRGEPMRTLNAHWTAIFDRKGRLQKVLVTLRDVSNQLALEKNLAEEKARAAALPSRMIELFRAGWAPAMQLLHEAQALTPIDDIALASETGKEWRRKLHSLKGDARTLGIRSIAGLMHQLEDDPQNPVVWMQLRNELQEYQNLTKDLKDMAQDSKSLAALVSPLLSELRQRLAAAGLPIGQIQITDSVSHWSGELSLALKPILIHALQNSVDHGYLRPLTKGWSPRPFSCEIHVEERGQQICLSISDHGAGIDFTQLAAKARKLGLPETDRDQLLDLLFDDGFSTAESVSESSGRGIGLGAIRSLCRKHGGDVVIVPKKDNQGIVLQATFALDSSAAQPQTAA